MHIQSLPTIQLSGAGGTQRLPRTIGTPAALMHILMGVPLTPREAERKGLVHETVSGKALDRAMEIAQRLSSLICLYQARRPQRHRDAAG